MCTQKIIINGEFNVCIKRRGVKYFLDFDLKNVGVSLLKLNATSGNIPLIRCDIKGDLNPQLIIIFVMHFFLLGTKSYIIFTDNKY